jgi:hypothetical protein
MGGYVMNINAIEKQCQNAVSGASCTKNTSVGQFDSFQKAFVNYEKGIMEAIDKERDNDSKGNIQMSEKQWHNLKKKVDKAIDIIKDKQEEQEQRGNEHRDNVIGG